jgi:hypothetical protein
MQSIHDRARQLAAQLRITVPEALAELGRRGSRVRVVRCKALKAVEAGPGPKTYWWNKTED